MTSEPEPHADWEELPAPAISVVIPLRDEAPALVALYDEVRTVLEDEGIPFELVFVDDGSEDTSPSILAELCGGDPRVRAYRLRRQFGKAGALATGFREAGGAAVVTMDADLQDDPAEIPRLLARLSEGFGLVSGWKRQRHDPMTRRLASRLFNWTIRLVTGVKLHDFNCGLKVYTRECAREVADSCYGEQHRFLPVVAAWKGFHVAELEVNHRSRPYGRSRYGPVRYLWGLLDLLTSAFLARFARRPMHVFGTIGFLLLIGAALCLLVLGIIRFGLGDPGPTRLLLALAAVHGVAGFQLLLAGLLAEMVSRLPNLVLRLNVGQIPHTAITPARPGSGEKRAEPAARR